MLYPVSSSTSGRVATPSSKPAPEVQPPPANNFDALRFWAALSVLWSHSIPLTQGSEKNEPLFALSGGQTTTGTLAVTMFFVISGYLITKSFERSRSLWRFIQARVLRIMPALLCVLFVVAFIIGPSVSSLSVLDYLRSPDAYRYVLLQATFLSFPDLLPGVFTGNPNVHVNGSLWTLRYEVICYAAVFLLGVSRLLNRWVLSLLYCAGLVFCVFYEHGQVSDGLKLMETKAVVDLGTKFLAGALIYKWGLSLRPGLTLVALGVAIACLLFGHYATAARTVVPYVVMYLAIGTALRLPSPIKLGDLSYGVYIYAWPVKQLVVMNLADPHWVTVAGIATPIVLVLAWLSWHLVEKVAMSFKDRTFAAASCAPASVRQA